MFNKYKLILITISFTIVSIWFSSGKTYGTGETEITFLQPDLALKNFTTTWREHALGTMSTSVFSGLTLYLIPSILFGIGIPTHISQAIIFLLIFCVAGISTYEVIMHFKPNDKIAFVGAVFYLLNPYSLTSWNRFLMPGILMTAWLPLFLLLYLKYLKLKNTKYLVLLGFYSFAFSHVYVAPSYVLTQWIPVGVFFAVTLWHNSAKERCLLLKQSLKFALFWLAVNSWWIMPYLSASDYYISKIPQADVSFDSLVGVSQYFKPLYSSRMINRFYMFDSELWGSIYKNTFFELISWIPIIFVVIGLLVSKKEKKQTRTFYFALTIVALFLIKGTNPPFGALFYKFIFSVNPFFTSFRNPYEKLGVILPLAYSFFVGVGVYGTYRFLKRNLNTLKILVFIPLFMFAGLYMKPMWTDKAITGNSKVVVPDYYYQANIKLSTLDKDSRILHIPLVGHGVKYNWEDGYEGGEASALLFSNPSLGRLVGVKNSLALDLIQRTYEDSKKFTITGFKNFFNMFNFGFVIIRNDIATDNLDTGDWEESGILNIRGFIDSSGGKKIDGDYGKLELYSLPKSLNVVYFPKRVIYYNDSSDFLQIFNSEDLRDSVLLKPDTLKGPARLDGLNVSYSRKEPTKLTVSVEESEGGEILVFSENFHPLWKARAGKTELDHFVANGYANGYALPKGSDYEVVVEFESQKQVQFWGMVSILVFVATVSVMSFGVLKKT